MVIAERIKEKRKELGWSQQELADRMDYSKSAISRIEGGEFDLPQSRISQFARVLGTTPGYLLGWDVEPEDAGAIAAKVLKSSETFQMVQDYFNLSEADKYTVRLLVSSLVAKQKKD